MRKPAAYHKHGETGVPLMQAYEQMTRRPLSRDPSRIIPPHKMPKKALAKMSASQRSYIDDFTFVHAPGEGIDAWYVGELLAHWNGREWIERAGVTYPAKEGWKPPHHRDPRRKNMRKPAAYRKSRVGRDVVPMPMKDPAVEREFQAGILEAVWMDSYMFWAEKHGLTWTTGHIPQHVRELSDIPQAVPQSAKKLAAKFASLLVKMNKATLTQIWARASHAEHANVDARSLGFYLTMQAAGHGISWTDSHESFDVTLPAIEWYAYGPKGKVRVDGSVSERLARRM